MRKNVNSHRKLEDTLSLLVGIGMGSALMYLLDPDSGRNRRGSIFNAARSRAGQAGHSLSDAGHRMAQQARDTVHGLSADLADRTSHASDQAMHAASDMQSHLMSSLRGRADQARKAWQQRWHAQEHHSYIAPAAGITTGAIALVAIGAGLAYFFDPDRGVNRRSQVRDQICGRVQDASEFARKTGQHVSETVRAKYDEARNKMNGSLPNEQSRQADGGNDNVAERATQVEA
jgi:gas vesicle protein